MTGETTAATDIDLLKLVQAHVADLRSRYPSHDVRVIVSTAPPGYPDTDEEPVRPVMLELLAQPRLRVAGA
ncbi:MAG: hypothetical protein JNK84_13335 [Phreatobacter sp.]|uniref:hypothetical protein n=1 Tax=Phreatobacter sp. TaxID=1966341 RepID=UPI001A3C8130|nr:hypothetical protein [Phreatobacter sp.]MBL8570047.1 hypothetical protein [Phreatobacter sp.]